MKSILITGAASGIGAATAKKLASKEVSLTLTTKSNLEGLKSVTQIAENKGAKVCCYLSEKKFLKDLVSLARNKTGNIDQFISNAGYADKKEFGEFNNDDLNRSVQTMAISFSEIIKLCIEDFKY